MPAGPGWPPQPALPAASRARLTSGSHGELAAAPAATPEAEPGTILAELVDSEGHTIGVMIKARPAPAHAEGGTGTGSGVSVREVRHHGHTIMITTTYQVSIDGRPLGGHLGVADDGTVHHDALPGYRTASALDLVKRLVDAHPDSYPPADGGAA